MTQLIRLRDLLTAGPLRRRGEARVFEILARYLDEFDDLHAAAVLGGYAAQLRTWRPA